MPLKVAIAGGTSQALGVHVSRGIMARPQDFHANFLVRQSTLTEKKAFVDEVKSAGAEVTVVDGKTVPELASLLQGVDVIVSIVFGSGFALQAQLIEAAQLAGVKRFLPSEFGVPLNVLPRGRVQLLDEKYAVREKIKQAGVPAVFVTTGMFMEWALSENLLDWKSGKVTIYGSGTKKLPLTSVHDIATWLPDVLLDPAAKQETVLVGNMVSWNNVIAAYNEVADKPLEVTYVPEEQLKQAAALPNTPENIMAIFGAEMALAFESGVFEAVQPSHPPGSKAPLSPKEFFKQHLI